MVLNRPLRGVLEFDKADDQWSPLRGNVRRFYGRVSEFRYDKQDGSFAAAGGAGGLERFAALGVVRPVRRRGVRQRAGPVPQMQKGIENAFR